MSLGASQTHRWLEKREFRNVPNSQPSSIRTLFSSRTLFSLSVFSLTLVGFGAVAYAASIPAVLSDPFEVDPVSDSLFDSDSKKADTPESSANVDSVAASDGADINATAGEGATPGLSSLTGSPSSLPYKIFLIIRLEPARIRARRIRRCLLHIRAYKWRGSCQDGDRSAT